MYYIDNIQLSILIHLLIGEDVVINAHDPDSLHELEIYISSFDSLFKNELVDKAIDDETYKSCIAYTVSNHSYTIKVSCNSQDRLREYLTEYARLFELGELQEVGCRNMFESAESLEENLLSDVKDIKTSKVRYKLFDIKFAPLILSKYLENEEFIKSLSIDLLSENDITYPIRLYEYDSSEEITGMVKDWQNNFICLYELNIAWYLEELRKKEAKTVTVKRRTEYSPQQKTLFGAIIEEVERTKMLTADPYNLKKECKTLNDNNIDMAVSRLNKEYREINNTDKTLLKKHRKTDLYDVLPNFIPPEEN